MWHCSEVLSLHTEKNIISTSMKNKKCQLWLQAWETAFRTSWTIKLSWNDEQHWEVLMLPEFCMCCSFFVLMNKCPDKNPLFLFQVGRWNARVPLWVSALENPKTDFAVLCIRNVTWHNQFFKELDAFWCFLILSVPALLYHDTDLVTCHL